MKTRRGYLALGLIFTFLACWLLAWVSADATVTSTVTPRKIYSGNDVTVAFPITFPYNDDEDLVIVVHVDSGLVETTWTLGTEYTIASDTVTATTAPKTGESLVLYRVTPQKQETDLRPNRRFSADTEEAMFDKQVLMVQETNEAITRSIRLPVTASQSIDVELPMPVGGSGIGWNSAGDGLENQSSPGTITTTTWSESLLDDTNRIEGRATLGVGLTAADIAAMIVLQASGGYVDGELVTTLDYGNIYTWDDGNSKWIVHSGNLYATADLPTTTDFTVSTGTWVYDVTIDEFKVWTGAVFVNYRATEAFRGSVELATAAEVLAGTDAVRVITPATQQNHLSAAKAWVSFEPDGTILDSYNIDTATGITDNGTGDWTIPFDVDFNDANYVMTASCQSSGPVDIIRIKDAGKAAGTVNVTSTSVLFVAPWYVASDPTQIYCVFYGTQ